MDAKHNMSGAIGGVAKVWVINLEVLEQPAFRLQRAFKCIDERGRGIIVGVNNKGVKATALLAVGDDLSLELKKMSVFQRSNSSDGAVDDTYSPRC